MKNNNNLNSRIFAAMFAAYVAAIAVPSPARAETASLSDQPLANSGSGPVPPNLMYIYDDSGSMEWDHMPDNVLKLTSGGFPNGSDQQNVVWNGNLPGFSGFGGAAQYYVKNCKDSSLNVSGTFCADIAPSSWGEPPHYSPDFNKIYYNPDVWYSAPVDYKGNSKGDSAYTAAANDGYKDPTTLDLSSKYPDIYYCIPTKATFTANINGTTLTVKSSPAVVGIIEIGDVITDTQSATTKFTSGTKITAQTSGTTGGAGVYTVSISQSRTTDRQVTITMPGSATAINDGSTTALTGPSATTLANTTYCKRNGINNLDATNKYFLYNSPSTTNGGLPYTGYTERRPMPSGYGYYYTITAHEYCKDANLWDCALANPDGTAPTGYTIPAPIRYCKTASDAGSTSAVADAAGSATHKCQKNFETATGKLYTYARYGRFKRVNLDAASEPFKKSPTAVRPDCAQATTCSLAEEQKNFANWYTWYRTRNTMMKSATGIAFQGIQDNYRVGFVTINAQPSNSSNIDMNKFLPVATFDANQKKAFYDILYGQTHGNTTPLREALARVGRYYAGNTGSGTSNINKGMIDGTATKPDPVTVSCQQNFALLTTDGYWNDSDSDAQNLAGNQVGNQDNTPTSGSPIYVSRATGTIDGQGTTERTDTTNFVTEQGKCSGNGPVDFGDGGAAATTACGCTGVQTRNWQRTRNTVTSQSFNSGKPTGSPNTSNVSGSEVFTPITGCTMPFEVTQVTPKIDTQRVICTNNNATSFAGGGSAPVEQQACGCSGSGTRYRLMERKKMYNQTVITRDGVAQTPTNGSATYTFTSITPASGSCPNSNSGMTATGPTTTNGTPIPAPTDNKAAGGTNLPSSFPATSSQVGNPVTVTLTAAGFSNTLADVAMYYYKTDLRATMTDNVPTNSKDVAPHQHMTTFTLGLGLKGVMEYQADYETSATGDFAKIKAATIDGCSWITTAGARCDWPQPASATSTTLDDLWHAAVNGRGVYYSASDPNTLSDGLTSALNNLKVQTAAASASATSSPNITETENFIYSSTFRTVKWDGEVVAQRIDTITGNVIPKIEWSAQALLDARIKTASVAGDSDDRTIWTFDSGDPQGRKAFLADKLTGTVGGKNEIDWFKGQCSDLGQCSSLSLAQKAIADDATNMVNYLRGQSQYEGSVFRDREHVLGDPVNATPAFISRPRFAFNDAVTPDYSTFQSDNAKRQGILYIAANDGMLHALNGDTGKEEWAYVPRMLFPNMHLLASDTWVSKHKYLADGSPQIMDIYDTNTKAWRTILVAGLNKGGKGFYALDITDPVVTGPLPMWEICNDATLCEITDDDLGYSFGNPVITKRASDGQWVVIVTSGVNNNTDKGTGRGFLYVLDALTGKVLDKVEATDGATTVGDLTTPSGFSKISAYANNFNSDNTATLIYGGDLFGNVWRYDMSVSPPTVMLLAQLTDAKGNPQSITTRPELAAIDGNPAVYIGTGRYLGMDDLVDPATVVPPNQWAYQQSLYGFADRGKPYGLIRKSTPGLVEQKITDTSGVRTITSNKVTWNGTSDNGWFVDFNPGTAPGTSPGERVNLDPQLVLGTLVVTTNVPNNVSCSTGGDSFLYQFDYQNGSYVNTSSGGVVAQKFTGQITVGVVIVRLPSGIFKGIATGATGSKTTVGVNIGKGGASGRRVSWRELVQ